MWCVWRPACVVAVLSVVQACTMHHPPTHSPTILNAPPTRCRVSSRCPTPPLTAPHHTASHHTAHRPAPHLSRRPSLHHTTPHHTTPHHTAHRPAPHPTYHTTPRPTAGTARRCSRSSYPTTRWWWWSCRGCARCSTCPRRCTASATECSVCKPSGWLDGHCDARGHGPRAAACVHCIAFMKRAALPLPPRHSLCHHRRGCAFCVPSVAHHRSGSAVVCVPQGGSHTARAGSLHVCMSPSLYAGTCGAPAPTRRRFRPRFPPRGSCPLGM